MLSEDPLFATLISVHAQAASASTARQLDRAGALAMLAGRRVRFLIKRSAVTLGRPTTLHGMVRARPPAPVFVTLCQAMCGHTRRGHLSEGAPVRMAGY